MYFKFLWWSLSDILQSRYKTMHILCSNHFSSFGEETIQNIFLRFIHILQFLRFDISEKKVRKINEQGRTPSDDIISSVALQTKRAKTKRYICTHFKNKYILVLQLNDLGIVFCLFIIYYQWKNFPSGYLYILLKNTFFTRKQIFLILENSINSKTCQCSHLQ